MPTSLLSLLRKGEIVRYIERTYPLYFSASFRGGAATGYEAPFNPCFNGLKGAIGDW